MLGAGLGTQATATKTKEAHASVGFHSDGGERDNKQYNPKPPKLISEMDECFEGNRTRHHAGE